MLDEPKGLGASCALVTGAAGFIGGHLCRLLGEQGVEVHGVSRQDRIGGQGVTKWWRADLADPSSTSRLLEDARPDTVFHLASHVFGSRDLSYVLPTFRDSLASTVNLLTAAAERGDCGIVLSGSMDEPRPGEAYPLSSPYAAAKSAASTYARLFHDLYELPITIARIGMVYGPDQKDEKKLVPSATRALLTGESPELSGGSREVDWVYVEDVAEALATFGGLEGLSGRTLDVGTGVLTSVRSVVEMLAEIVGGEGSPSFGDGVERPRETRPTADTEATFEATGWRAETSLREGLERTVDWYRQH